MVTKMDIDREYHVFLFEKIILCCKEVLPVTNGGTIRKSSKNSSILKKHPASMPSGMGPSRKKTAPLLLKGRIFLNNVTHTRASITSGKRDSSFSFSCDFDHFSLQARSTHYRSGGEGTMTTSISH